METQIHKNDQNNSERIGVPEDLQYNDLDNQVSQQKVILMMIMLRT